MADTNNPIPGIPPALLQALTQVPSRGAAGLDAFNQGFMPSLNNAMGNIGEIIKQKKQKDMLNQLVQAMNPPSQQQSMNQVPPGQPMSASLGNIGKDVSMPRMAGEGGMMQAPPPPPPSSPQNPLQGLPSGVDVSKLLGLYMKTDPERAKVFIGQMIQQKMGGSQMNPLQQSEIAKNLAMAQRYNSQGQPSKPTGTIFRNSQTGEMTDDPNVAQGPEWKEYKTTQGDVLNKLSGQTSGKERNKALSSRSEVMARGIDARQIDRLAQTVGVTSAQRNLLQQNNMRANRAIELASKPMTWQEFGAVTTDAAAIMQGGTPQVQQLHDMSYPSWKQDLARAQTYMTSTPQATVPDEFKDRIIGMIQGIQKVDNRYLTKNAEFMQKMLAPTIRGGVGQFKAPIDDMTKTITESAPTAPPSQSGGGWSYVGPAR